MPLISSRRSIVVLLLGLLHGFCVGLAVAQAPRQETTRHYLSGTGFDDAVDWEFSVSDGRRAGEATTIPVPSVWEQHGFGSYNYGHDEDKASEQGRYRHTFEAPESWRGQHVELVFDGVMTDAEVTLNGELAGPIHQGAFYRFRYDVTRLLRFGETNTLEVLVSKQSANRSVNLAERDADYWVFGGIFRPVFLEASPVKGIERIAVDARHDGTFRIDVLKRGVGEDAEDTEDVELRLRFESASDSESDPVYATVFTAASEVGGDSAVTLSGTVAEIQPWSAERPHLYRVVVELVSDGNVLHRVRETIGFRTVEARAGVGLFVNGHRVLLRGVNRHSFWPESGRTLTDELNRQDAELIKAMNLNAVRMSHYPPDPAFLEACDELGIYVINELGGWHDAYDAGVGRKLVREMVERDVNHPSIIMWANGNEGGHNLALDSWFRDLDPQKRIVLRPRSHFGGFRTDHYPTYEELRAALDPTTRQNRWRDLVGDMPLVMPTEMLHGLYDGGSGAGLEDFWSLLRGSPHGVGGFLWAFTDEAIVRTDRAGELDTDGNHAPDGVLGPYRERTGNYHAVRAALSPIRAEALADPFDGRLRVENRYDETDLSEISFEWEAVMLPDLDEMSRSGEGASPAPSGRIDGPSVQPWKSGELTIPIPQMGDGPGERFNGVTVAARDPQGRVVAHWVLPTTALVRKPSSRILPEDHPVDIRQLGNTIVMSTDIDGRIDHEVAIEAATGRLLAVGRQGKIAFEWSQEAAGPRLTHTDNPAQPSVRWSQDGARACFDYAAATERSPAVASVATVCWTLFPSGWLKLDVESQTSAPVAHHGLLFGLDRERFRQLRFLGEGPFRVWANRQQGGTLGVWSRDGNDSEFEGFYGGVRWAELTIDETRLDLYVESGPWLGLFSPDFPDDARTAIATVPEFEGFGVYHVIPGIGTKFKTAEELGPQGALSPPGRFVTALWIRASRPDKPNSSSDQPLP